MRLVFAGTPEVAVPSLHALLASSHEVVAVLTRPDAPAGRGRSRQPSPIRSVAEHAGVPVLAPTSARDPEFLERLRELAPDAGPVVAYGNLLPRAVLAVPRHGWVNLHFSLLPAWRGAAPVQHAVLAGDDVTGASTFLIEEAMDTGPLLGTMTERVRPDDTAGALLTRLATAGADLLVASLDALESGTAQPVPQGSDGVSYAPKVTVEDARVRWSDPALAVDRRIRASTPAPGAWTTFRGERLKLGPVRQTQGPAGPGPSSPGELVADRTGVWVGTGTEPVQLGEVQPPGKRAMPAADWARGARPSPGERLGLDTCGG
ncbi:MAG: methionyl-tRNA formyltransferase [Austwickia sp.]|nr:methionyl-tRNA formyltransferase [Austwickia sp.]